MSVKFLSAILGPEMVRQFYGHPEKMRSFCRKNPCPYLVNVSDIFYFFSARGGEGGVRGAGVGGEDFLAENPRRGGLRAGGGGGARGPEGVCAKFGGGGG